MFRLPPSSGNHLALPTPLSLRRKPAWTLLRSSGPSLSTYLSSDRRIPRAIHLTSLTWPRSRSNPPSGPYLAFPLCLSSSGTSRPSTTHSASSSMPFRYLPSSVISFLRFPHVAPIFHFVSQSLPFLFRPSFSHACYTFQYRRRYWFIFPLLVVHTFQIVPDVSLVHDFLSDPHLFISYDCLMTSRRLTDCLSLFYLFPLTCI